MLVIKKFVFPMFTHKTCPPIGFGSAVPAELVGTQNPFVEIKAAPVAMVFDKTPESAQYLWRDFSIRKKKVKYIWREGGVKMPQTAPLSMRGH